MSAFNLLYARKVAPFRGMPGPTPRLPDGNLREYLRREPHEFYFAHAEQYGPVSVHWLLDKPYVLLNDPELVGRVLTTERERFYKDAPRGEAGAVLRSSVFISNDRDWETKRTAHPFSRQDLEACLDRLMPTLRGTAREGAEALARGTQPFELYAPLVDMSFAMFSQALLGQAPSPERRGRYEVLMREIDRRMHGVPLSVSPRFWLDRFLWFQELEAQLRQRRASPDPAAPDILSLMVRQGSSLGEEWIRDEASTVFIAGAHPVATAVCSTLYQLSRHPEMREQLVAELRGFTAVHSSGYTLGELHALPYLERVVSESLRLLPPVTFFFRTVREGQSMRVGEHTLPAGTNVVVSSWALHRLAPYWKDPLRFEPERFASPPPPFHYLPFGLGPRTCVGRPFALACIKIMLTEALTALSFNIDPAFSPDMRFFAGLSVPRHPVRTSVRRLEAWPRVETTEGALGST
ncbi:cytochrome P450 [Archangium sp.]|uniref:cytochrome P450 n=1 Tax=Archangium sp. TaxID=1872627 RepID=UPI002D524FA5|nr:cytochrome P450 [Archangium sp.]HYO59321.1 cytochrome P450 [Archangium sp.]